MIWLDVMDVVWCGAMRFAAQLYGTLVRVDGSPEQDDRTAAADGKVTGMAETVDHVCGHSTARPLFVRPFNGHLTVIVLAI